MKLFTLDNNKTSTPANHQRLITEHKYHRLKQ